MSNDNPSKVFEFSTVKPSVNANLAVEGPVIKDAAWKVSQAGTSLFVSGGFRDPFRFVELRKNFAGNFDQRRLTPMEEGRWFHAQTTIDKNTIVVSGGAGSSGTAVEQYNRQTDSWTYLPDL